MQFTCLKTNHQLIPLEVTPVPSLSGTLTSVSSTDPSPILILSSSLWAPSPDPHGKRFDGPSLRVRAGGKESSDREHGGNVVSGRRLATDHLLTTANAVRGARHGPQRWQVHPAPGGPAHCAPRQGGASPRSESLRREEEDGSRTAPGGRGPAIKHFGRRVHRLHLMLDGGTTERTERELTASGPVSESGGRVIMGCRPRL